MYAQRVSFSQDVFQMVAIAIVLGINQFHINGYIYFMMVCIRYPQ